MLVCEQHYDGAKHNRKIAVELEKFHQARRALYFTNLHCTPTPCWLSMHWSSRLHVGYLCIYHFHFNDNPILILLCPGKPKRTDAKEGKDGRGRANPNDHRAD